MPPTFAGLIDALAARFGGTSMGADETARVVAAPVKVEPDDVRIEHVGAWAGTSCYETTAAAKKTVALAKTIGLSRLDIIVNDDSGKQAETPYEPHDLRKISVLAELAADAGLVVHLLSWLMPHRSYIEAASDALVPFCDAHMIASVCFDCEEPWTKAKGKFDYDEAGMLVEQRFASVDWGVTGIGYAPADKLGPIVRHADYGMPQCYATAGSGVSPATAIAKLVGRWRKLWPTIPMQAGLAAYHQSGIPGYTAEGALRAAFGGAQADLLLAEIVYWSFGFIRNSALVQRVLADLIAKNRG